MGLKCAYNGVSSGISMGLKCAYNSVRAGVIMDLSSLNYKFTDSKYGLHSHLRFKIAINFCQFFCEFL